MNIKKLFLTKEGKIVIGQSPDRPLILWAFFFFVAYVPPLNMLQQTFQSIASLFLFVWAYQELIRGVNPFRKIIGSITMLWIIASILL